MTRLRFCCLIIDYLMPFRCSFVPAKEESNPVPTKRCALSAFAPQESPETEHPAHRAAHGAKMEMRISFGSHGLQKTHSSQLPSNCENCHQLRTKKAKERKRPFSLQKTSVMALSSVLKNKQNLFIENPLI